MKLWASKALGCLTSISFNPSLSLNPSVNCHSYNCRSSPFLLRERWALAASDRRGLFRSFLLPCRTTPMAWNWLPFEGVLHHRPSPRPGFRPQAQQLETRDLPSTVLPAGFSENTLISGLSAPT